MQEWLASDDAERRIVGLTAGGSICESLGEQGVATWPVFMNTVIASVCAENAQERNAASYAIALATPVADFGAVYGALAYPALGEAIKKFPRKSSDNRHTLYALDN